MIVIQIKNIDELVAQHAGRFAAKLGGLVGNVEAKVERAIMEKLQQALSENGVEADILSVGGFDLRHVCQAKQEKEIKD